MRAAAARSAEPASASPSSSISSSATAAASRSRALSARGRTRTFSCRSPGRADDGRRSMSGGKLLLVEDDKALAELLVWHFERQGFEGRRTAGGEEALLLAEEEVPDILVLDWMIEGVSGLEVCRRLRRRAAT